MQRRPITAKFEKSFRTSKILTSRDYSKISTSIRELRKTWLLTSKPKALRNVSKYFYLLCNMKRKSISFHQPVSTWWRWSLATVIPSGNVPSVWAACVSWPCQREVFPQKARWINTHESWSKQGCRIVFCLNCLTMICHFSMANLKCGC